MDDIGHFPMSENYPVFKKYLEQALEVISERSEGAPGPRKGAKKKTEEARV